MIPHPTLSVHNGAESALGLQSLLLHLQESMPEIGSSDSLLIHKYISVLASAAVTPAGGLLAC